MSVKPADLSNCPTCNAPLEERVLERVSPEIVGEAEYVCPTHGVQAHFDFGHYNPACPIH